MFLIIENEAHYKLSGCLFVWCDDFARLVLLELNGLEEVNKYSSPSSLLVVKLISVERRKGGFNLPLFTACSAY
jgi:hypothetical protein